MFLESIVLLVGIFIIEVGKTYFCVKFLYRVDFFRWFSLDVGPLWQKEHVLRVDFMMATLFHIVVWTPMSTKLWGFSCFLTRIIFGLLVVHLTHLTPHVHFQCFGHVSLSLFVSSSLALVSPWPFVYSWQKGIKYTLE